MSTMLKQTAGNYRLYDNPDNAALPYGIYRPDNRLVARLADRVAAEALLAWLDPESED